MDFAAPSGESAKERLRRARAREILKSEVAHGGEREQESPGTLGELHHGQFGPSAGEDSLLQTERDVFMRRAIAVGAGAIIAVTMGLGAAPAAWAGGPPTTYVPVTSADLITPPATPAPGQFAAVNEGDGSGGVTMVTGPAPASGSLQLTVSGTGSHWGVFNVDHDGTTLSSLTSLSYSTFTNDAGRILDPGLQLLVNPGNTTGIDAGVTFSTLNFEPYLQPPSNPVVPNTWQTWNVLNGVVWGTHLTGAPQGAPISWSTFVAEYPNATIKSGVGVGVGSNWSAMVGNVGGLTIGTSAGSTAYIFEPIAYLQITTSSLPAGALNSAYSATLAAIGGNPPYKWSVSAGRLPKGLHLSKTTGTISGTPNKHDGGIYAFTVTVVDKKVHTKHQPTTQNTASQALSIAIT